MRGVSLCNHFKSNKKFYSIHCNNQLPFIRSWLNLYLLQFLITTLVSTLFYFIISIKIMPIRKNKNLNAIRLKEPTDIRFFKPALAQSDTYQINLIDFYYYCIDKWLCGIPKVFLRKKYDMCFSSSRIKIGNHFLNIEHRHPSGLDHYWLVKDKTFKTF